MNTITELIENIERADVKLEELNKNGNTNKLLAKKLNKYKLSKQALYKRLMNRKNTWDLFGKATQDENEACTISGDEIFMEMVNGHKVIENKPKYFKYYDHLNISDELKEENYARYKKINGKYKMTKELYTYPNGTTSYIYVTKPVEVEKYRKTFDSSVEVSQKTSTNKKRTLADLFNDKESNNDRKQDSKQDSETTEKSSKYVPPSIKNGGNTNNDSIEIKRKLIIRNIPRDIMEDDIAAVIMTCGKIHDIRIHRDKYTGESKGFAFVKCETNGIAKKIIETYDRKPLGPMIMRIDFAEDKRNKR